MTSIEEVFGELNFPSSPRLKRVLTTRGIPFNASEVGRRVRGETTRQVQAPTYKFDGKIAAADVDSMWFADLIDFSSAPSEETGNTLDCGQLQVVIDTFWLYRMSSVASCMQRRSWTSAH